ncbi:MAG: 1-acyl-sn-glycerol-3-phosphate acyltransferase [Syntrophales bacterium]|jgi:1-acyl-sn-glycerol-3-phosphate acyltransferase|nr:1-acyl-sn-glycerol-3-phosphate acyltransferase [Syntrophales bacterium]MDY0045180.1 lysophospholipid acyltransferase family protein [Syntrophales bacterium]
MQTKIKRLAFILYRPFLMAFIVLQTFVMGLAAIIASLFDPRGNAGFNIGKTWSRNNLRMSGVRVSVQGLNHIKKNQPYIVMANHQSHYDVLALMGYLPLQFRWVMKIELRRIPFFGFCCERIGTISIDRGNSEKARQSLQSAGEKIRQGASIMFFPEGTRSSNGQLLPFKKGGFVIALAAGVPILPVTVRGGMHVLPKGTLKMVPGSMELVIHDPIPVSSYSSENKEELMQMARTAIESELYEGQFRDS